MSEPYFGSPEEAASELGAPLLVAATAASALPRAGRRLSEYAVETILGAHLFHRLRLASPQIPEVIWVTGPHGTLEHIGWAVGIAEHAAASGRAAYLALLDGVQPLQGFATGTGLVLPRSIVSRIRGFGVAEAAGWVSDLQGVRLVFPTSVEPTGDQSGDPFRWILVVARALPEEVETTQRYRKAADGVVFAAAIRDHHREELLEAAETLHGPGAPLLGLITMGPVTAGALPIIERWEHILISPDEEVPETPGTDAPRIDQAGLSLQSAEEHAGSEGGEAIDSIGAPAEPRAWEPPQIVDSREEQGSRDPKGKTQGPPSTQMPTKRTSKPPSSRRPALSSAAAGLGDGIRPREDPVPLVAGWLPSERRKRGARRLVVGLIGAVVVVAALFVIRGGILRRAEAPVPGWERPPSDPSSVGSHVPGTSGRLPETTPSTQGLGDSSAASLAGVPTGSGTMATMTDSIAGTNRAIAPLPVPRVRPDSLHAKREATVGVPGPEESVRSPILQGSSLLTPPAKEAVPAPGAATRADTTAGSNVPAFGTQTPSTAWPDTFFIHVSSYQQLGQAEEETKRLKGLGIDARVASVLLPARGMWYRVIVGAFPDSMAAWREAAGLREIGYIAFAQVLRSGGRKGIH